MTTALRPNKYKVAIATGVIAFVLSTRSVDAQSACSNVPHTGNYTVTTGGAGCYIAPANEVEGLDSSGNQDGSITNDAILTVANGGILTIPSGTTGTTKLIVGSISIEDGGSISIGSNAEIMIGAPIYMMDADGDGYQDSLTRVDATAAGRRRRSLLKSLTIVDCNSSDGTKWDNTNAYTDGDGDGQAGSSTGEVCAGASLPPGYSATPGTDCDDANQYAYLNSTYCMTTARSGGSWDYNCSTTNTLCGTTYNKNCTTTSVSCKGCVGSNQTNCGNTTCTYYGNLTYTCGATGCIQATTSTYRTTCTTNLSGCNRGGGGTVTATTTSGTQACQ